MKKNRVQPHQLRTAKRLLTAAAVCLFGIYLLFLLTDDAAKRSEKAYLVASLAKVLPKNSFDNDLLASQTPQGDNVVYQACKAGNPRYQMYEIHSDKGYSGQIKLLVAIDMENQRLVNVRPLFHQETPGLGDQIEVEKSTWLQQFRKPLSTEKTAIAIKQDGGQIDAITGATITSRAVANVIAQQFFDHVLQPLPPLCDKVSQ